MVARASKADYKSKKVLKDSTVDMETFGKSLLLAIRGKKRGTAPGPNGIPIEIYKGLLSVESDLAAVKKFAESESSTSAAPVEIRPLPDIVHVAVADDDLPNHMATPMGQAFEKLLKSQILHSDHFARGLGDASITPLVKNPKGDISSMDNRRGLAVGNEEAKIMFTMLARQLSAKLEASDWFTKMQSGFRANQECIGQFITLFEIARRCRLKKKDLFVVFIDLQKAFDTVMHEAMWLKLEAMGLGGHELEVIKSLYKSGKVRVKIDELFSYSFEIGKGTQQGDPLSPLLFIIFINDLLIGCPFGATIPGLSEKVPGLLFADDLAGLCNSIDAMSSMWGMT
ncbi:BQ2448_6029 [Microbotryum intermedium]|uniref:BQ2448_6029 protein n=1 Tax=Microbotryum intermedium TaxID=269621 RepID=A0A238F605_9BASI|nr:BQ2448_6029 [Microbotryum intermedium]